MAIKLGPEARREVDRLTRELASDILELVMRQGDEVLRDITRRIAEELVGPPARLTPAPRVVESPRVDRAPRPRSRPDRLRALSTVIARAWPDGGDWLFADGAWPWSLENRARVAPYAEGIDAGLTPIGVASEIAREVASIRRGPARVAWLNRHRGPLRGARTRLRRPPRAPAVDLEPPERDPPVS